MPAKGYAKKSIKNTSLVPVLFTLGVIGWGFFAIDRLTSSGTPAYADYTTEAHDYVQNPETDSKSWKKTAEQFITKFTSKKVKEDKDPESENWTVVKEDVSPDNSVKIQENNFSEIKSNEIKINSYFLYYYHDINGKLKLSGIPRKSNRSTDFKNIFKEIVSGPEFLHEHKKLIDSFPVKPTVINAYVNNKTLFLNLDDNFGRGISFETAQLQIEQILKTASQFKNINSVQFLINSEEIDSIHVDGLMIPSKLKTNKSLELSTAQEE